MKKSIVAAIAAICLVAALIALPNFSTSASVSKSVRTVADLRVNTDAEVKGIAEGEALLATLSVQRVESARTAYQKLTPTQKRNVWRAKLNATEVVGFSDAQIDFLLGVVDSLDSVTFDGTYKNSAIAYNTAVKLFGRAKTGEVFGRIGLTSAMLNASLTLLPDCACKADEDFCSHGSCDNNGGTCNFQGIGCGWLWTGYCDGLCSGRG